MPKKNIPQEYFDAMVVDYLSGSSRVQAAAKFGYSATVCKNELNRRGIKPRLRRHSQDIKDMIVADYQKGISAKVLARQYGVSSRTAYSALEEAGIKRRDSHSDGYRKFQVNQSFFECIDTEAKAYFLGLIATDGYIKDGKTGAVGIQLQYRDKDILETLSALLGGNTDIKKRLVDTALPQGGRCQGEHALLTVYSKQMVRDLIELGVGPCKSLTIKPWQAPTSRPDLRTAWWRGCVDGDGWLFHTKRGEWHVGFCGSQHMVQGFAEYAKNACGTNAVAVCQPNKNLWSFTVCGTNMPRKLALALYGNATIALERKRLLAEQIIDG